jgi:hypothetical protein
MKMITLLFMLVSCSFLACLFSTANARDQWIGRKAPYFKIASGSGELLTLDEVKGKVVVIFYETKEVSKKNAAIKDRFNELYDSQPAPIRESIVRLPVFNCSSVVWPVTYLWKDGLVKNSARVGITIYGDWDGKMFRDYGMKDNESNVMMLDKSGFIRYFFAGKIDEDRFEQIKSTLADLVIDK